MTRHRRVLGMEDPLGLDRQYVRGGETVNPLFLLTKYLSKSRVFV